MTDATYYSPTGGLPPQTQLLTDRAMFREAYAVIPRGTNSDIVTSYLPFWDDTRLWVLARPLTGFAETFSQYMVEVAPGGGSERPELDPEAEGVVFLTAGPLRITLDGTAHKLDPGGYAYIPPGTDWSVRNEGGEHAHFHWIRKAYERVEGLDVPEAFVTNERDVEAAPMPDTDGQVADQPVRRPGRPAPRHARQHRDVRARRGDPVRRDPRHGARALRPGGQGRLPAQRGLGRGAGGRLHVAAGLLPAGLLRRRSRDGSATCSTRTSTGT